MDVNSPRWTPGVDRGRFAVAATISSPTTAPGQPTRKRCAAGHQPGLGHHRDQPPVRSGHRFAAPGPDRRHLPQPPTGAPSRAPAAHPRRGSARDHAVHQQSKEVTAVNDAVPTTTGTRVTALVNETGTVLVPGIVLG